MKRVPPSEALGQEWETILTRGVEGDQSLLDALVRTAARYMLQRAVEEEVTEFFGRGHYQRGGREREGYRNGYEPKRLMTGQGPIELAVPQVRGTDEPFHSALLGAVANRSQTLEELVRRMYVRGMSQRDVADTFREMFDERAMSKTMVSQISKSLQQEFDAWRQRSLAAGAVIYLFLDAIYLKAHGWDHGNDAVLCAYGITETGKKVLLHLEIGEKESYLAWHGFLTNLVDRGLTEPILVASDGGTGLRKALREVYPKAIRQRCKVHKLRNILARAPKSAQKILKEQVTKIFRSQDYKEALKLARTFIERYQDKWPGAVSCLEDDLEACLAHLKLPPAHHKATGTTNLIERLFEEGRRRTKVIGRFPTESSCLRLFFATLMAAGQSWRGIRMTPAILTELRDLRDQLYGRAPAKKQVEQQAKQDVPTAAEEPSLRVS